MGREVRMVPADWKHPKDARGRYIPLMDNYRTCVAEWDEGSRQWEAGFVRDFVGKSWKPRASCKVKSNSYEEWDGPRPVESDYMPDWPASERTHYQMYEDTTEGTPISPVMETPEALARWLADNKASASGSMTATYEQWLSMIRVGHAPAMMSSPETGLISGVEAVAKS